MEAIDWEIKRLEMELSPPPRDLKKSSQQKGRKKRKKKSRLIKKLKRKVRNMIKIFLIMLGLITIINAGVYGLYDMYLKSSVTFAPALEEEGYSERIRQIEHIMQLNDDYYGVVGGTEAAKGRLATYNIEKDKLRIYNIGSYNSEDGMCLGFSMYEKFNYMDALSILNENMPEEIQLSEASRQDLGLIQLDEMDEKRLYGGSQLKAGSRFNLDSKTLYDIYTGVYKEEREDFSAKIENKQTREILNVINYIQEVANEDIKQYPQIIVAPREYTDLRDVRYFKHSKAKEQLKPEWITERIDADEPVVIGISNTKEGHALLVYAYDYIEEDILKFYVSDSNLELINEKSEDQEKLKNIKQYNQDVRENVYVLCVKDTETQRWEYIYNPKINNNYIYKGRYNSYIPGTYMSIYEEQFMKY